MIWNTSLQEKKIRTVLYEVHIIKLDLYFRLHARLIPIFIKNNSIDIYFCVSNTT